MEIKLIKFGVSSHPQIKNMLLESEDIELWRVQKKKKEHTVFPRIVKVLSVIGVLLSPFLDMWLGIQVVSVNVYWLAEGILCLHFWLKFALSFTSFKIVFNLVLVWFYKL